MDSECAIKVIIVFAIIIFAMWIMFPRKRMLDTFDSTGTELLDVQYPDYDMRGYPVKRSCILRTYMKPERNVRLNLYGGEMYTSDYNPIQEGKRNCRKVPCPVDADYTEKDTCWTCGSLKHDVMKIPDIHPHVMN